MEKSLGQSGRTRISPFCLQDTAPWDIRLDFIYLTNTIWGRQIIDEILMNFKNKGRYWLILKFQSNDDRHFLNENTK
jgi:hypothetical protein